MPTMDKSNTSEEKVNNNNNNENGERTSSKVFAPKKKFLMDYQSQSKNYCRGQEETGSTTSPNSKAEESTENILREKVSVSSCIGKIVETELSKYKEDKSSGISERKQFLPMLFNNEDFEADDSLRNKSESYIQECSMKVSEDICERNISLEKNIPVANSLNPQSLEQFRIRSSQNLLLEAQLLQQQFQRQQLLHNHSQQKFQQDGQSHSFQDGNRLARESSIDSIHDNKIQHSAQLLTASPGHTFDLDHSMTSISLNNNKVMSHNFENLKLISDPNYNIGTMRSSNKSTERYFANDPYVQRNSPKMRFNDLNKFRQPHVLIPNYDNSDKPSTLSSSSSLSSSLIKYNTQNLNLDESPMLKSSNEDYYRICKQQQQRQQQHQEEIVRFFPSSEAYNHPHYPSSSSSFRARSSVDEAPMDLSVKKLSNQFYSNFSGNKNITSLKRIRNELDNFEIISNDNNNNNLEVNNINIGNNVSNNNSKHNTRSPFIHSSPDVDRGRLKINPSYPKKSSNSEYVKKPKEMNIDNFNTHLTFKHNDISLYKNKHHRTNIDNFNMYKNNNYDQRNYQDANFSKSSSVKSNKYEQIGGTMPTATTMMKSHELQFQQSQLAAHYDNQEHYNARSSMAGDISKNRSFSRKNESNSPTSIPFLLPISPIQNRPHHQPPQQHQQQLCYDGSIVNEPLRSNQKFQCKVCESVHTSYRNFRIHFAKDHGMEPHPDHCFQFTSSSYPSGTSRNVYKGHLEDIVTNVYQMAPRQIAEVMPIVAKVPMVQTPTTAASISPIFQENNGTVAIRDNNQLTDTGRRSLSRGQEINEPHEVRNAEVSDTRRAEKKNCLTCLEGFEDITDWRAHISSMHMIRSCACRACNKYYANAEELNKHLQAMHSDTLQFDVEYKCIYCSKVFTDDEVLYIHTREHEKVLCISHIESLRKKNEESELPMAPDTTCPEFDNKVSSGSATTSESGSPHSEMNSVRMKVASKRRNSGSSNDDNTANQSEIDRRALGSNHSSNDSDTAPACKKKFFMKKFQEEKKNTKTYDNHDDDDDNDNDEEASKNGRSKTKMKKLPNTYLELKDNQPLKDTPQPSTSSSKVITARNIIDDIVNQNLTKTSPPPTFKKMFPNFDNEDLNLQIPHQSSLATFVQSHSNRLNQQLTRNINKCGVGQPSFTDGNSSENNNKFNLKNVESKETSYQQRHHLQQHHQQQQQQLQHYHDQHQQHQQHSHQQQQPLLKDMLSQIKSPTHSSASSSNHISSNQNGSLPNQSKSKCVRDICDEIITHSFRESSPNSSAVNRMKILESICFTNLKPVKIEKRNSESRSSTETIISQLPMTLLETENISEENNSTTENNSNYSNGDNHTYDNTDSNEFKTGGTDPINKTSCLRNLNVIDEKNNHSNNDSNDNNNNDGVNSDDDNDGDNNNDADKYDDETRTDSHTPNSKENTKNDNDVADNDKGKANNNK